MIDERIEDNIIDAEVVEYNKEESVLVDEDDYKTIKEAAELLEETGNEVTPQEYFEKAIDELSEEAVKDGGVSKEDIKEFFRTGNVDVLMRKQNEKVYHLLLSLAPNLIPLLFTTDEAEPSTYLDTNYEGVNYKFKKELLNEEIKFETYDNENEKGYVTSIFYSPDLDKLHKLIADNKDDFKDENGKLMEPNSVFKSVMAVLGGFTQKNRNDFVVELAPFATKSLEDAFFSDADLLDKLIATTTNYDKSVLGYYKTKLLKKIRSFSKDFETTDVMSAIESFASIKHFKNIDMSEDKITIIISKLLIEKITRENMIFLVTFATCIKVYIAENAIMAKPEEERTEDEKQMLAEVSKMINPVKVLLQKFKNYELG